MGLGLGTRGLIECWSLYFFTFLNFFHNEILRRGRREEGNYQWGLYRAPTVIYALGVRLPQVPRGPLLCPQIPQNVPVAPHLWPTPSPSHRPSWDAAWVFHSQQPLLKEEATEKTQTGDNSPYATARGSMGTKAGCPPPSQYFQLPPLGPRLLWSNRDTHPTASADSG